MRWLTAFGRLVFLVAAAFSPPAAAIECTNYISNRAPGSNTEKYGTHYQQARMNDTWLHGFLSRYHLTPSDDAAWMGLPPENRLHWAILYRSMKRPGPAPGWKGGSFLKETPLHGVRLDPDSVHGQAQQTNLEYLLLLDPDRLVWSFRKTAGLRTIGQPYGGWEKPDGELRGHFVGHFMSATALMWASTHNETIRDRMNKVVDALDECQKAIGTGYLSAFPTEEFDRYEAVVYVRAPYYTIHKIMAGLLDQYTFAGNPKALNMVIWMAEYFSNRVTNFIKKYTIARHWAAMNEETGGINDVLYNLYSITGDEKHLVLAHLFDKPCFLGPLALQVDSLSGLHANTHIPILIGAQRRYELTGDSLYRDIGTVFMDFVNSSHTYATGGTSENEHRTDLRRLVDTLKMNTEESCSTYNMLKSVAKNSTLGFRIPIWTSSHGAKATLKVPAPGKVLSIAKKWSHEDGLTLQLPIGSRTEAIQDDRPEYSSTKAILFGHYLLAGLSHGAWDLDNGNARSISDWISPVPAAHNSQLISLTQEIAHKTLFLSNVNRCREAQERILTMEESPNLGTNAAAEATFRLVYNNDRKSQFPSPKDLIGESVMLEPFDLPGKVVEHQGPNNGLIVAASSKIATSNLDMAKFRVVAGLDGNSSTISLES
ncbi:hypothetical protein COCNU_scaffold012102G000010 [Cocos nucifera]|nr:hypothetical protein [Cocos nucifera]